MNRYARRRADGLVITAFNTLRPKSDFSDLAPLLDVAADVLDNDYVDASGSKVAPPAQPRVVSARDFMLRFTGPELTAIRGNNTAMNFVVTRLLPAGAIDLDDVDVVVGMTGAVSLGLITAARKIEILS